MPSRETFRLPSSGWIVLFSADVSSFVGAGGADGGGGVWGVAGDRGVGGGRMEQGGAVWEEISSDKPPLWSSASPK